MNEQVTGGDLLALWRVSKVHMPRIADVFSDASTSAGATSDAEGVFSRSQAQDANAQMQDAQDDSGLLDYVDPNSEYYQTWRRLVAEKYAGVGESPESLSPTDFWNWVQERADARKNWETKQVPGRVYPHWRNLRDELQLLLALAATNTMDSAAAVNAALNSFRGVDADNAVSVTEAGRDFDGMLTDKDYVDPNDPNQQPPTGDGVPNPPTYPTI